MSISTWPHPRVVGLNLKTLNRRVNKWPSQVENIYFKASWVWPSTVDAEGTAYCVLAIGYFFLHFSSLVTFGLTFITHKFL